MTRIIAAALAVYAATLSLSAADGVALWRAMDAEQIATGGQP